MNKIFAFFRLAQIQALVARISSAAFSFLFTVIAARCTDPVNLGHYYILLSTTYVASAFSAYGFSQLCQAEIPRQLTLGNIDAAKIIATEKLFALTITVSGTLLVFLAAFSFGVLPSALSVLNDAGLIVFLTLLWISLYTYQNYFCDLLKANFRTTLSIVFQGAIANISSAILVVILFWSDGGALGLRQLMIVTVIGLLVQNLILVGYVRSYICKVGFNKILNGLKVSFLGGRDFFLNALAGLALAHSSVWIIATLLGPDDVAAYGVATRLMAAITLFSAVIYSTLPPHIVRLLTHSEMSRLEFMLRYMASINLYVSAPALLVLLLFPNFVLSLLFGDGYVTAAVPIQILSIAALFNIATGVRGQVLLLSGHQRVQLYITIGSWISSVLVAIILAKNFGLIGAACGFSIGVIIQCVLEMVAVRRVHSIKTHFSFVGVSRLLEELRNVSR